ncbi:ABC transporter substrate-binding protein [Acidocella aminolytica]|jgi:putative hydroxymethylpyrimidine transport system substrate-binding protein|uniref:ABC transporter n=1 Tax=Acidocella aminolytica 101 = DSM 11237 TaxID=1120923 RepID=A0A0D6PKB1_9PROT|nr:ABC transporter substrate-binding protein [Acidocella aminolytica]GAN82102.1 ABC transporter [Acidocella aminolytica 101 = DSM 11237]GBQ32480.1 nitrate/sulfonate/bicarbonate ABC transporter substrate-binding periplasmic protein [Acidocella aminolytica 101 = DSM 11237]SHE74314.1 putative hydroxymethylpyrimidine transport system substrate-binding protein [Acidocella aminolytica 101 = DSM 11237]
MSLNRRSFLSISAGVLAAPAIAHAAMARKFTLILDWFINPDHAPLFAAKYCGAYENAGLDVKLIAPTDPDVPPRLVAAGKADAALTYQTQLYLLVNQSLPVRRTGTLINKPLNTLTALKRRGITKLTDLKGRKVGYSVAGVEPVIIGAMLKHVGMSLKDIQLVNVNFELVSALRSNEVDAVIGTYRTYEDIQLAQEGLDPVIFLPEDYGVPPSDELILLSNANELKNPALPAFLGALKQGVAALKADPDGMLKKFLKENPSLNDKLDIASWHALPPYFDNDPAALDAKRYETYRDFLFENGVIKQKLPLGKYAVTVS